MIGFDLIRYGGGTAGLPIAYENLSVDLRMPEFRVASLLRPWSTFKMPAFF